MDDKPAFSSTGNYICTYGQHADLLWLDMTSWRFSEAVRKLNYLTQAFEYPLLFDSQFLAVETVRGRVAEIPTYIPLETENRTAPKQSFCSHSFNEQTLTE